MLTCGFVRWKAVAYCRLAASSCDESALVADLEPNALGTATTPDRAASLKENTIFNASTDAMTGATVMCKIVQKMLTLTAAKKCQ